MAMANESSRKRWVEVFFSPAISLMGRLDVFRKFTLLGLMSLIAIGVVIYSLFSSLDKNIDFMQRELKGVEIIKLFPHAVQVIQQHRGLSAGVISGNAAMRGTRAAIESEVVEALHVMEKELPPSMVSGETMRLIRADWEYLRKDGLNLTGVESFAVHTRLINRIKLLEGRVADEYALILDPELDTYYLIDTFVNKLPEVLEHLGQLRAYGTGILARKHATEQQKIEMSVLVSKLDDAIGDLKLSLDKTGRYNTALQGLISVTFGDIAGSAGRITGLVASDILSGRFATPSADFYGMSTTEIDRSYRQIHEALLPMTTALIKARMVRAENTLHASIGIALMLFLAVAYFSVGICRAITVNIWSIARSAHAFACGNLRERIDLDAHDELGLVRDSFNEMADGFNELLNASRKNEARLQELSVHLEERVKERIAELEQAHRETEVLLLRNQALIQTSMDGIHVMDREGNIVAANEAFCHMLGYTQEEMLRLNVADWDVQTPIGAVLEKFDEFINTSTMFETLYRCKDGTLIDAEVSASIVELEGRNFIYATSRNITQRKQAEVALRRYKVVIDTAIDGFWMTDMTGYLKDVNQAYARISGYSVEELLSMHIGQLEAIEQSPEEVLAHIEKIVSQGYDRFETRHRHKDGHLIDIEVSATYMAESRQFFVFCHDITQRKRAEEEIRSLAFYDPLTKLPNRRLFIDRFHAALPVSARHNSYGAVLFIDLDKFKILNDTLGHEYGDLLLIEVAKRIKSSIREMDTVARFGGDEFVVLIEEIGDDRADALCKVALIAEKIREALARPYWLREKEYHSSPSIGVSLYHGNEETPDELLRHADLAMYQVKNSGRNAVRFFEVPAAGNKNGASS